MKVSLCEHTKCDVSVLLAVAPTTVFCTGWFDAWFTPEWSPSWIHIVCFWPQPTTEQTDFLPHCSAAWEPRKQLWQSLFESTTCNLSLRLNARNCEQFHNRCGWLHITQGLSDLACDFRPLVFVCVVLTGLVKPEPDDHCRWGFGLSRLGKKSPYTGSAVSRESLAMNVTRSANSGYASLSSL